MPTSTLYEATKPITGGCSQIGKPARILEQAIQKQILDYLRYKLQGHLLLEEQHSWHLPKARNTYIPSHAPGASDILGILKGGRFLATEVKSKKGRVSPQQEQFLAEIEARGGVAFVARSVEEVEKLLLPVRS